MRLLLPLALFLAAPGMLLGPAVAGGDCVETTSVDTPSSAFDPPCIIVRSGDVVTWLNVGARPHQLSSDEPAPLTTITGEPCIQSDVYDGGESVSLLFLREGDSVSVDGRECTLLSYDPAAQLVDGERRIPYHCTLHRQMRGQIVVR